MEGVSSTTAGVACDVEEEELFIFVWKWIFFILLEPYRQPRQTFPFFFDPFGVHLARHVRVFSRTGRQSCGIERRKREVSFAAQCNRPGPHALGLKRII